MVASNLKSVNASLKVISEGPGFTHLEKNGYKCTHEHDFNVREMFLSYLVFNFVSPAVDCIILTDQNFCF